MEHEDNAREGASQLTLKSISPGRGGGKRVLESSVCVANLFALRIPSTRADAFDTRIRREFRQLCFRNTKHVSWFFFSSSANVVFKNFRRTNLWFQCCSSGRICYSRCFKFVCLFVLLVKQARRCEFLDNYVNTFPSFVQAVQIWFPRVLGGQICNSSSVQGDKYVYSKLKQALRCEFLDNYFFRNTEYIS